MSRENRVNVTLAQETIAALKRRVSRDASRTVTGLCTWIIERFVDPKNALIELPEEIEEIKQWASQTGHSVESLCAWLVKRSLSQAKETGEFKPATPNSVDPMGRFLDAIEAGNFYDCHQIAVLAAESDRDVEFLTQIQNCFKGAQHESGRTA